MKRPRTVRRAIRVLEVFGVSEPLIGDLEEEFHRRGSRLWYWRQTLVTVGVSLVEETRSGMWRALGAVSAGWAVLLLWGVVWSRLSWQGMAAGPAWLADTRYPAALGVSGHPASLALLLLTTCGVAMAAAGVAGRVSRPGRSGLVLFLLTLPVYAVFAASQWIVGQAPQVVLTFGITHALAMTSAAVAALWSLPMKENRKGKMPRPLVYGGWALGGLGLGGLALGAALLTGRVELAPVARIPAEALTPERQSVFVPRPSETPDTGEEEVTNVRFSPDGRFLAYVSEGEIYVRSLDGEERSASDEDSIVPGETGGASRPVWAPDGGTMFFFENGELKARSVDGEDAAIEAGPDGRGFRVVFPGPENP